MFSIFKNDVSKRFPLRRGIRGRMFPSDYGIFFSIFSFFPLPPIHLVIPSESRELWETRDPALQRPSFSLLLSTLAPYCLAPYCLLPALQRPVITLTFQQILFVHFGLCLCYTNFAIRFFVFRSQHFLL